MRIYLDDNTASALLVRLLQKAGHDVQAPADVGLAGTTMRLILRMRLTTIA